MQLTHKQAHQLIQRNLDRDLQPQERLVLSDHLQACPDCQAYVAEMKAVEQLLSPMLKRQWNRRPLPLSIPFLTKGALHRQQPGAILATRTAAVGLIVLMFFFSAWQFVFSSPSMSRPLTLIAPSVPTPSTISTATLATPEDCETMLYTVQGNDTLASIAHQFSVAEEEIAAANSLGAVTISAPMELRIPVCNFTPTGTVHPATFTTTYTPSNAPTVSTPDG